MKESHTIKVRDHLKPLNRRGFMKLGLGAAGVVGAVSSIGIIGTEAASAAGVSSAPASANSGIAGLDNAYVFLDHMMDLYAKGNAIRLSQSYAPTAALDLGGTAFTYDSALALIAYLQRHRLSDLERAAVLGDSLIYGQEHDSVFNDGRLRDAYFADPYITASGTTNVNYYFGQAGSAVGNMAWAGLALAHLYTQVNNPKYLDGAMKLGAWIQQNTYDTRGAGGFNGGFDSGQNPLLYKATEHNIDAYALFTILARLTHDKSWTALAQHALTFIQAMWDSTDGHFWTGTGTDGVTINTSVIPEDVQSWSYLALRNASFTSSLDWARGNLSAVDGPFAGVSFSDADRSKVWLEGTGHMAAALAFRNAPGDAITANYYLQNIHLAQQQAPNADHNGVVAASHDGLNTGFGFSYFAALHTGATSWYAIAAQKGNPFRL